MPDPKIDPNPITAEMVDAAIQQGMNGGSAVNVGQVWDGTGLEVNEEVDAVLTDLLNATSHAAMQQGIGRGSFLAYLLIVGVVTGIKAARIADAEADRV